MAAVNRPPPAHPELVGRNPNVSSSVQQDPGPLGAALEPGFASHPQHPMFGRPVVYVQPPPPPLFHYPWSMPFSYNPFAGFPGLGFGMIVPPHPFPPPPYMDAGGYILPPPHVHPVDYRRLPHPQGPSHPNPVQVRRTRPTQFFPVRETVNSEVQTEPVHGGRSGFDLGSDSGRGTCSNSPCSLALSSPKPTLTEGGSGRSPCREGKYLHVNEPCRRPTDTTGFPKRTAFGSCGGSGPDRPVKDLPGQELILDSLSKDGDLWLSSSPVRAAPVSSSSQKDDVLKERRVSVPDILNWGGGTAQVKRSIREPDKQDVEPSCHSSTETNEVGTGSSRTMGGPNVSEGLFRILRLPHSTIDTFLESTTNDPGEEGLLGRHSLAFRDEVKHLHNSSHNISAEAQETDPGSYLQELSDVAPHRSGGICRAGQRLNESVWSVESLPAYIPPREWLLKSSVLGPEVRENMMEVRRGRSGSPCVHSCSNIQEEGQSPGKEETQPKEEVSEPVGSEQSQSEPLSENMVRSSSCGQLADTASAPTEKDEDEKESPEAAGSPNQRSLIPGEPQQNSLPPSSSSSSEEEPLSSAVEEPASSAVQVTSQSGPDTEEDGAPTELQNTAEVLPSKGTLVDCGVQCNQYERKCFCEETNHRQPHRPSDMKRTNEGRKKRNHWRSSGQDRPSAQQEAYSGHCRGGSKGGRNPRYH